MAPEVDLEVNSMEVLPAGPRRSRGEPLLSQLSVADTIQACRWTKQTHKHTHGGLLHFFFVFGLSTFFFLTDNLLWFPGSQHQIRR